MRRLLISLLALLALSACATPAGVTEEGPAAPPPRDAPADPRAEEAPPDEAPVDETEDHVLLTLEAPLADGRILTLVDVGKVEHRLRPLRLEMQQHHPVLLLDLGPGGGTVPIRLHPPRGGGPSGDEGAHRRIQVRLRRVPVDHPVL